MNEIKKCAHCGGFGTLWSVDQCNTVYAVCINCGIRTIDYATAEQAIAAWNRRHDIENELSPEAAYFVENKANDILSRMDKLIADIDERSDNDKLRKLGVVHKIINYLDTMNENGQINYEHYSVLHDMVDEIANENEA